MIIEVSKPEHGREIKEKSTIIGSLDDAYFWNSLLIISCSLAESEPVALFY